MSAFIRILLALVSLIGIGFFAWLFGYSSLTALLIVLAFCVFGQGINANNACHGGKFNDNLGVFDEPENFHWTYLFNHLFLMLVCIVGPFYIVDGNKFTAGFIALFTLAVGILSYFRQHKVSIFSKFKKAN
jgi:hypothetical protein